MAMIGMTGEELAEHQKRVDAELRESARIELRGLVRRLGWSDLLSTLAQHAADAEDPPLLASELSDLATFAEMMHGTGEG